MGWHLALLLLAHMKQEEYQVPFFTSEAGGIVAFVRESNLIEGIDRVTEFEVDAHVRLFQAARIDVHTLCGFQAIIAPNKPLRSEPGMDVQIGSYVPPGGGPFVPKRLNYILLFAFKGRDPWKIHVAFESLHPFMDGNGRTGRALWAWQMLVRGGEPFRLPFLQRFYYQTLQNVGDPRDNRRPRER